MLRDHLQLFFGDLAVGAGGREEDEREARLEVEIAHRVEHRLVVLVGHVRERRRHVLEDGLLVVRPRALVVRRHLDPLQNPRIAEVVALVHHVAVGDVAVALVAPAGPPRVANDEHLVRIGVADAEHRVRAVRLARRLDCRRHGDEAGALLAIEGVEEPDAEDDGVARGESALPRVEIDGDELGVLDDELRRFFVRLAVRLVVDLLRIEGPCLLGAGAVLLEAVDHVLERRALILDLVALELARVVVDEHAADVVGLLAEVALDEVLVGARRGVGGAAVRLPLVLDGRHVGAEVHLRGQPGDARAGRRVAPRGCGRGLVAIAAHGEGRPVGAHEFLAHGRTLAESAPPWERPPRAPRQGGRTLPCSSGHGPLGLHPGLPNHW